MCDLLYNSGNYSMSVRLDKYLANLGICSRRDVESLLQKRVLTVNGNRVKEHGERIDPEKDEILLDNKLLQKFSFLTQFS